ncbi:hypothetical protein LZF95_06210 [Algoriphagus sp. AGSA1]|uniref:hypothetical protein n=1 Tax=Algoriphagus sp. AGSA1 TaxID=2907213 RepID=UPI001F2ADB13|nr:hypothetical protein [Algoriphagus sp. AGSA1]MCE7054262.1 hypothetical protein [Algoriphagus sp. AGSA1]
MKKSILLLVLGILVLNTANAQKYFGKSYEPTQHIDEYFDSADVKESYTVMGKTELLQGFRSLERSQEKINDLAKKKGADGVIFSIVEEIYGTSTSSGGSVKEKKKNKTTASSSSATVDLTQKKILATFIKYK